MTIEHTVKLPGGILIDGELRCSATFKPLTGFIEQKIEDIRWSENNPVAYVSRVLKSLLKQLAGMQPSYELLDSLSVVDRQFLMIQAAIMLEGENIWYQPECSQCAASYDVKINRQELPVIQAKGSYPYAVANIDNKEIILRIPQGKDQIELQQLSTDQAIRHLLHNCVEAVNKQTPNDAFFSQLTHADIEAIESALDDVSPAVCTQLSTECPECASREVIQLNPYLLVNQSDEALFADIHSLASHYHWSEEAILALPRDRRQRYLKFIDKQHGKYT